MNAGTIVVIEDEAAIQELLDYNLTRAGYRVVVSADGNEGLIQVKSERPDLVLLDWMLPSLSGIELCRLLREEPGTRAIPVIMLTAKGEEADKIEGLTVGADDYVTKPFSPSELIARIGAVLRRAVIKPRENSISVGPLAIDLAQRKLFHAGKEVYLGPTEFRLIYHFMQHPGEVFSRDQLLELVWDKDIYVEPRTVDVHIRRLRKALNDDGDLIRTVRLAGYALNVAKELP